MTLGNKYWRKLLFFGLPLAVVIFILQSLIWWTKVSSPVQAVKNNTEPLQVKIQPGTAIQQIGNKLRQVGLIRSQLAWDLWAKYLNLQDPKGGFKAGTYKISPSQSLPDIAAKIWQGDVLQNSFTIPEGWSLQQMAAFFEKQGFFSAQDFLQAATKIDRNKYPWLPADIPFLEGFLYPDSYNFDPNSTTPEAVVTKMLERFERVALPVYQKARNSNSNSNSLSLNSLSLKEWVILSSIVEKEAVVAKERRLIAGVFTSRLRIGMALQSDPTVEYGLGIRQTADKPLTFAQVRTASPYNTYINPGFPPTPIASPGLASLKATLDPQKTDYLYFVARYDGTHIFSRTLKQHEAAVKQIRKQRQTR